jgi:hypothetical protein
MLSHRWLEQRNVVSQISTDDLRIEICNRNTTHDRSYTGRSILACLSCWLSPIIYDNIRYNWCMTVHLETTNTNSAASTQRNKNEYITRAFSRWTSLISSYLPLFVILAIIDGNKYIHTHMQDECSRHLNYAFGRNCTTSIYLHNQDNISIEPYSRLMQFVYCSLVSQVRFVTAKASVEWQHHLRSESNWILTNVDRRQWIYTFEK